MMYELTGTTASSTYGRLVQVVDGLYYDGFGNLLTLGGGTYSIGPQGPQGPQGATGVAGSSFTYEGDWDDMVTYFPNEVVTYNGGSYLNLLPSSTSGSPPYPTPDISSTIWGVLSLKGSIGSQGVTGSQGPVGGTNRYFIQAGPPAPTASNVGDRWYDLSTGQEFVWINDGDSSQWVVPIATPIFPVVNSLPTVNYQPSDSYTLSLNDNNTYLTMTSSSDTTIIVPSYSHVSFAQSSQINVIQYGTGSVSFTWSNPVIVHSELGYKKIKSQYSSVTLINMSTDTWLLIGSLM